MQGRSILVANRIDRGLKSIDIFKTPSPRAILHPQ